MTNRYVIRLSCKDHGRVSYFPCFEIKDDPEADWIDTVLVPAIAPLLRRRAELISELPITFWIGCKETARYHVEAFVFMTPSHPRAIVKKAVGECLQSINLAKVHAGLEPIPKGAFPCLQVFRGHLMRFYTTLEFYEGFYLPMVQWGGRAPELHLEEIPECVITKLNKQGPVLVRADTSWSDGEAARKFQQALNPNFVAFPD